MTLEQIKQAIEDRIKELEPIAQKEREIRGPIFYIRADGGHIRMRETPAELELGSLKQMLEPFNYWTNSIGQRSGEDETL